MDTVTILNEFAAAQGINKSEVDAFLSKYNSPKTLKDLSKLPTDMLEHISYITRLEEPLKSFIEEYDNERYETIDLEEVIDWLEESKYDAGEDQMKKFKAIEEQILKMNFGSVVYDW